jgi:hypothetical protein
VCRDLGIDDPIAWFESIPESVFDGWVAFYSFEREQEAKAGGSEMSDPGVALAKFKGKHGI